jgi:hypothetical protein
MRLINADEIIKCFDPETWQGEMMIAIAESLPTAYNVEAVVKELKKASVVIEVDYDFDEEDEGSVECVFLSEAIEIVRRGGVK